MLENYQKLGDTLAVLQTVVELELELVELEPELAVAPVVLVVAPAPALFEPEQLWPVPEAVH